MLAKPFFVVGGVYCLNMSKLQALFSKVLIFCENKSDVDDVHEYLLLKAVEARENSASFTSLPAWPTIDHGWNQTHPNHFGLYTFSIHDERQISETMRNISYRNIS